MKPVRLFFVPLFLLVTIAQAQTSAPATPIPAQRADVPAPKLSATTKTVERFQSMHKDFVERAKKGDVDLLFLGDSITEGWLGRGKEAWTKAYGDMKVANFGISGDKTQHVLWRIENGELDGIKPKVTVLMIGTNNVGSNPPEQIAAGIENIVKTIRDKTGSKVLLLAVFPRGTTAKGGEKPRAILATVNERIAKMDDGQNIRYLDFGDKFLNEEKGIDKDIMADGLHPTAKGYDIWVKEMQPLLTEMMK